MMGLLSSVKRRMSSRESGNIQPTSTDRFPSSPLASASEVPAVSASAGSDSQSATHPSSHDSSLELAGSSKLLISGLTRPSAAPTNSHDVYPRPARPGGDNARLIDPAAGVYPPLTPEAGDETPESSAVDIATQNASSNGKRSSSNNRVFSSRLGESGSKESKFLHRHSSAVSNAALSPTVEPPPNASPKADTKLDNILPGSQRTLHRSSSRLPTNLDSLGWLRSKDALPPGLLLAKQDLSIFTRLPSLKDTPSGDLLEVLRKKLKACGDVVFDWKPPVADIFLEEREAKKATLQEIMEIISSSRAGFLDQIVEDLIQMVSNNIFRPLPPLTSGASTLLLNDLEELEPTLETSWPHLTLIYEILLRFVLGNEVNPKTAKKHIDHTFVLKLLDLFASEDPRERDYLKTIMHRIYGKIMALRAFIRKAIQHVFARYIYENDSQHGVSELLEILGSIINGFAQPLKEEHKAFLQKSMIPLHKSRHLIVYHQQLTYCMTQYIEKDNKLVEPIISGLLRYWPVTNTPKEVLFVNEIEEILEITPQAEFQKIMEPLFKQMAMCIQSQHFQVSERVLFLWNNTRIVKLMNQNKNVLFPIVISALYRNTKEHWNSTVHGLTFNVCKLLAEADPHLFDQCNDENVAKEKRRLKEKESRKAVWGALQKHYASALKKTGIKDGEDSSQLQIDEYCDDGT